MTVAGGVGASQLMRQGRKEAARSSMEKRMDRIAF